jgi:hypothetical protein
LIFTGPTLSHGEANKIMPDAVCLPPAAQGAIVAAVQRYQPNAIAIIDGTFQSEPAVRHKEILWAISRGIPVIGAASMGALRAAELYPHMRGVGLIYRWYRRFPFAPDDAVAVLHGPAEVNFAALTHALIDLSRTIRKAYRARLISDEDRSRLETTAQSLNFRERSLRRTVQDAFPHLDSVAIERCFQMLSSQPVQQKKSDALEALRVLRAEVFAVEPPSEFKLTAAFSKDLDDAGLAL